jgi:amino acid transporter
MESSVRECRPIQTRLSLWDTVSIIVGIIIGVGIFRTPGEVFRDASGPWLALAIWGFAGLLSLVGAFCFAELASTYPRSGGEYVYLTKAYGPLTGFLFAWAQLAVIRTAGSIAAVAYIFADYAADLWPWALGGLEKAALAALAIGGLSAVNILGVRLGKRTQNTLTALKVVGLGVILLAALLWARSAAPAATAVAATGAAAPSPQAPQGDLLQGLALALIGVLWTYAGWHEAAYVAAEVENRRRNLPLALLLGTGAVVVLYLLVNAAYLVGLGYEAAASSETVAADVLSLVPWGHARQAMSVLVVVSALGAINGMIFTSSRIYAEFGADHRLFAPLARWSRRWGTPVRALVLQALLCIAMVTVVAVGFQGQDGFGTIVKCSSPVFALFFFLTGTALIVLRRKEPNVERPFTTPLYPLMPLLFCAFWAFMLCGSIWYAPVEAAVGLGILLAGLPLYVLSRGWERVKEEEPHAPAEALTREKGREVSPC